MQHNPQAVAKEGLLKGGTHPRLSTSRLAAAEYIREMARELADIAGGTRLPFVQLLFHMAYVETHDIIRGVRPTDGRKSPNVEKDD